MLGLVYDPCCKLDGLKDCLKVYHICLDLKVDITLLCINIRTLFDTLYDNIDKIHIIDVG